MILLSSKIDGTRGADAVPLFGHRLDRQKLKEKKTLWP
jgi:hypothetical protein